MKNTHYKTTLFCSALMLQAASAATVTVIGAGVLNGDFEASTAGGAYESWLNDVAFNNAVATSAPQTSTVRTGALAAGFGNNNGLEGLFQNTGTVVSTGDIITLDFFWAPRFNWFADQEVNYRLFTTSDNTTTGTLVEIFAGVDSGKVGTFNTPGNNGIAFFGDAVNANVTVPAANDGQQLWIEFSAGGTTAANAAARIDDVTLTVASVPEPSSSMLLGLSALGLLARRRRA